MRIIISPAKKMNTDTDSLEAMNLPVFLNDAEKLMHCIQSMTFAEAQELWKCNEKLTQLNYDRFSCMNLRNVLTPAILSYEGLQYQHMAPKVFTSDALEYIEEHLRILSGFYGVLRPLDGITPYRLEMQAKLAVDGCLDLYEYWGERLHREVTEGNRDRIIINLASKEYASCVEKYIGQDDRFITVEFGELVNGKVKQKGTFAKMARGEMVRFIAERKVTDVEQLEEFCAMNLRFRAELSEWNRFVFTV